MLNSDHLYYLVQVAKYGSITTAAEKMHITQPTVSLAIKKLEEQLNMQLLNRSFKGVLLTEEGKQVIQYAKAAFEYFDKIESMTITHHDEIMNDIAIYTIPAMYAIFSNVTAAYYAKYPQGNFRLLRLEDQNLDTLFVHEPHVFVATICQKGHIFAPDLAYTVLDSSKSYIHLHSDSKLLPPEQTSISYRELLKLPLILIDNGSKITQEFTLKLYEELQSYGQPNTKFLLPDMHIAANYILSDLGVCFYCDFPLMTKELSSNTLIRKVLIKNAPHFDIVLLYKKEHEPTHLQGVLELIDSIR